MQSRIADRLMRVRARQMVGRAAELDLFASALDADELPFLLLHLSGPNGIGKTTLLRVFAQLAEARNLAVTALDARNFEATPDGLLQTLSGTLGLGAGADPLSALAEIPGRRVLLLDTYEDFEGQEDWLREVFLPQLTADTLVILASCNPLSLTWRTDPGWREILRVIALRNLTTEESEEYLTARGVPKVLHRPALDFTHGYPLALSLVADMAAQDSGESGLLDFAPENAPHIVQALLDKFVDKAPTPAHRSALEIAALVRLTTEPLLAELLEGTGGAGSRDAAQAVAHELFRWLRGLSFMESSLYGLYPHETAREALLADLRWRNRERYNELHRRARYYYNARLEATQGMEQQRVLFDYFFLHRDNSVVRSAFDWKESAAVRADAMRDDDYAALVEMVHRYEGPESAELAAYWLKLQPDSVIVFRERSAPGGADAPAGFLFQLALHRTTPEERERDPAIVAAWNHLNAVAPLRPGEVATHFRFWMARDTYHAVSPVQSLIIVHVVRHYLMTRNLAHTFFPVVKPDRWAMMFQYAEIARIPEADFTVGAQTYGVFGNDWRRIPTTTWLERLADKETAVGAITEPAALRPASSETQLVVLSEEDFATAVRDALRHLNEPDILKGNPLVRSRLVVERVKADAPPVVALRRLVSEVVNGLQTAHRISRCYKPLYHTYIQPAPSQERAAEILDLPFSTYRRHLTEGIAEVTRLLWQKEIGETTGEGGGR
jgi:energy-coupling factor transporter ATP-binding protein EcfA2